jgi:hypothetical protein
MFPNLRSMTDQDKRHDIVEERLRSWLEGDEAGVRHAIVRIFLYRSDLSIMDIYEDLSGSFQVNYHSVAGMIGVLSSRIGVLCGSRHGTLRYRLYRLKEKDLPVVRRIISS